MRRFKKHHSWFRTSVRFTQTLSKGDSLKKIIELTGWRQGSSGGCEKMSLGLQPSLVLLSPPLDWLGPPGAAPCCRVTVGGLVDTKQQLTLDQNRLPSFHIDTSRRFSKHLRWSRGHKFPSPYIAHCLSYLLASLYQVAFSLLISCITSRVNYACPLLSLCFGGNPN